jgi:hypothetical protein
MNLGSALNLGDDSDEEILDEESGIPSGSGELIDLGE